MLIRSIFLFISMALGSSVMGQVGIRPAFHINKAVSWDQYFQQIDGQNPQIFKQSVSVSVDYWLRMKNIRIEFFPYLSYHQASEQVAFPDNIGTLNSSIDLTLRQFGLGLNTHFYLFDFLGDCECPTFSKQGGFFKKGFFLMGGIGTDLSEKKIGAGRFTDGNLDLKISVGLGLDIGISDLITLSPFVNFQYYPSISWHELGTSFNRSPAHIETSLSQWQLGLRIGLRPDYQ